MKEPSSWLYPRDCCVSSISSPSSTLDLNTILTSIETIGYVIFVESKL
jgi:hypothetical protein